MGHGLVVRVFLLTHICSDIYSKFPVNETPRDTEYSER